MGMNPLVYISAGLHFEISGSYMFGGDGTKGYMAINLIGIPDIDTITDELIDSKRLGIAKEFKVPVGSVRLISQEVYDRETENDDEYDTNYYKW